MVIVIKPVVSRVRNALALALVGVVALLPSCLKAESPFIPNSFERRAHITEVCETIVAEGIPVTNCPEKKHSLRFIRHCVELCFCPWVIPSNSIDAAWPKRRNASVRVGWLSLNELCSRYGLQIKRAIYAQGVCRSLSEVFYLCSYAKWISRREFDSKLINVNVRAQFPLGMSLAGTPQLHRIDSQDAGKNGYGDGAENVDKSFVVLTPRQEALPDGAVVERKTAPDLLGCIGRERERFERELKRGRYVGRFVVIIEGTLADVLKQARGIHSNVILGTLAAWTRRYCPFLFAGNAKCAARIAEAFLLGQVREVERAAKCLSQPVGR
jgi:hypothetical protein